MAKLKESSESQLYEPLSALVDGEASELEVRRILKTLKDDGGDKALLSKWERYQLIRTAIRGKLDYYDSFDVSASVSEAVASEPELKTQELVKPRVWLNFGRFAVAASVAGALVVGVQFSPVNTAVNVADFLPQTPAPAAGSPVLAGSASVSVVGNHTSQPEKDIVALKKETRQQLQEMESEINRLMLEHAQDASQNTLQGVIPYMRVPDSDQ